MSTSKSKSKRLWAVMACAVLLAASAQAKGAGVLYPKALVARARANIAKYPWAKEQQKQLIEAAKPWMKLTDDQLWSLMFGPTIHRSWMVLSDGCCPACKKPVPMYNWRIDAMNHPWKVQCPHCEQYFPKNDFGAYYRSGLDEYGIFDPKRAERTFLFNAEHPDPKDPLRGFGVDDGAGYVEGDKRWQFVSAYLIYGQWKQAVLGGIKNLASAYVVTGDRRYAHKAGILLDRVADLYPTFDFMTQADLYDDRNHAHGYVSVWHDACEENRELAMSYDMVFDGIKGDKALVGFLSDKAKTYGLPNPKSSFADVQRNIEERILLDTLNNVPKITSNYPRTPITMTIINAVLGREDQARAILDPMLEQASAVDGVTGEKGLDGYTSYTIQMVASLLQQFSMLDSSYLKDILKRHPRVRDMFRFHIDTWCMEEYYPQVGDAGNFGQKCPHYVGVIFTKNPGVIYPSMYCFLWNMYEVTGDADFVKVLYGANDHSTDGLPYDLFDDDPAAFQKSVKQVIDRVGPEIAPPSVNKQQWHIAILRSGEGANARALWIEYDAWGGHGHANCMEVGLYAKGLDLLPDFGYKPVQYGGWEAPRAVWYGKTAAHNTVVVDGADQGNGAGETKLWEDGKVFKAIRTSGPTCMGGRQYDRTIALVDISDKDSYIFDVFRVVGGTDHAKFTGSHFGTITARGLDLKPSPDYGFGTQMRTFQADLAPKPGWSVDWKVEDRYKYLAPDADVHFRCTDLTTGAEASTAEAWVALGITTTDEAWIPRVMTRRRSSDAPLASTFVALMEPYEKKSSIAEIRRLSVETEDGTAYPDSFAAVEVRLADGRRDLIISADAENPLGLKPARGVIVQKDWNLRTDAELCWVRLSRDGKVEDASVCNGTYVTVGDFAYRPKP